MIEILRKPVSDRSAWRGPQMRADRSWIVELTPAQAVELERDSLEIGRAHV